LADVSPLSEEERRISEQWKEIPVQEISRKVPEEHQEDTFVSKATFIGEDDIAGGGENVQAETVISHPKNDENLNPNGYPLSSRDF
jgi:hypothetical protein